MLIKEILTENYIYNDKGADAFHHYLNNHDIKNGTEFNNFILKKQKFKNWYQKILVDKIKNFEEFIDEYADRNHQEIILYRGSRQNPEDFIVGKKIKIKTFLSATANINIAKEYAYFRGIGSILFFIKIPMNYPVLNVSETAKILNSKKIYLFSKELGHSAESEFILNKNSKFLVEEKIQKKKYTEIHMTAII